MSIFDSGAVPIAEIARIADSMPCTIGCPKNVRRAAAGSTCNGL
jgi:hypothetical protein